MWWLIVSHLGPKPCAVTLQLKTQTGLKTYIDVLVGRQSVKTKVGAEEELRLSIGSDSDQMGRGSGSTCYLSRYSQSCRRIVALLCRGVALLRVLTLMKTERQRARLEAWEPRSTNAGQTLQVSEHTNSQASAGDTGGWLEITVSHDDASLFNLQHHRNHLQFHLDAFMEQILKSVDQQDVKS